MNKNTEHRIELWGLKGNHPLGALAAFGLLRCCTEIIDIKNPKLHWEQGANWTAILTTSEPLTPEQLISLLLERQATRAESEEFKWANDIKVEEEVFSEHCGAAARVATPIDRRAADFFAAYGCELILNKKGLVQPTAFHMTSGNQKFLESLRDISLSLTASNLALPANTEKLTRKQQNEHSKAEEARKEIANSFREALFGPWSYRDDKHSLGWDPAGERTHALRAIEPSKDKTNRSVRAAVWLAVEALPLFPTTISRGTLQTRAFRRENRSMEFTWALWSCPLSLPCLTSLIGLPCLAETTPSRKELHARGVVAVFRSQRITTDTQGDYKIFRPAQLCTLK